VPVAREPYDLVLESELVGGELLAPLWSLLDSTEFRSQVDALGGYDTAEMGRRVL
jgi:putative molybdopterin biosynthesis protein